MRGQSAANVVVDGTWRRYDFDAGTLSGTQFAVGLRGGQTPTNDNTADLLVWGAQLEAGSFATSYIPTVASQVTRSVDVASVNTLSPWYNATEGTLYVEALPFEITSSTKYFSNFSDGTGSNFIGVFKSTSSAGGIVQTSGVSQGSMFAGSINTTTASKMAIAYKTNDSAFAANTALATDSSVALPTVNQLLLGGLLSGASYANCTIRRITYYPRRLSNAELQAITA
jgi:hypothetical protein